MKVLVDTSAWVDFFNDFPSPQAQVLERLIEDEAEIVTCGVVIAEFFQGIRRKSTLGELENHFRDMRCLSPREPETYFSAARLYRDLRTRGVTIRSTIDCLIAKLAEENNVLLLAKDADLVRILDSGLTSLRGVE